MKFNIPKVLTFLVSKCFNILHKKSLNETNRFFKRLFIDSYIRNKVQKQHKRRHLIKKWNLENIKENWCLSIHYKHNFFKTEKPYKMRHPKYVKTSITASCVNKLLWTELIANNNFFSLLSVKNIQKVDPKGLSTPMFLACFIFWRSDI